MPLLPNTSKRIVTCEISGGGGGGNPQEEYQLLR